MSDVTVHFLIICNVMMFIALGGCLYAIRKLSAAVQALMCVMGMQRELWKAQTAYNHTLKSMVKDLQQEVVKQTMDL